MKIKFLTAFFGFILVIALGLYTTKEVEASSYSNFDIRTSSNLTAEHINAVMATYGKSDKLRRGNVGESIMSASNKYGINSALLASMLIYETGWGSSDAFLRKNNVGGLQCMPEAIDCSERWAKFSTMDASIHAKARLLSGKAYVGQGRTTLSLVVQKYAPSHENDVSKYVNTIGNFMVQYFGQNLVSDETVAQQQERLRIEAERKAKEEAERKAKEEAERLAREAEEKAELEANNIISEILSYKVNLDNHISNTDKMYLFELTLACNNSIIPIHGTDEGYQCLTASSRDL